MASTALLTDHYELTMVDAALRSGAATRRCAFEVFARSLPGQRRYGVFAGLGRLVEAITMFSFDTDAIEFLAARGVVDAATCEWLASYRFGGSIDGYAEGEVHFPGSPVLTVEGSFAECVVLETLVLSVLNHDSAVATAAARMTGAAAGRPCIEMGSRRTHEVAATASARAAYVGGFDATSNLAAGERWGIPTTGTAAHAFTLVHDDERSAFAAQVEALGVGTTLLVDTYDVEAGIRTAVEVAGPSLGAIRLDSGDLPTQAREARRLLDAMGATKTRIVVTSDLDEHAIAALASAPVDGYGVGTSVATGSGVPTAGFVYKLVAREDGTGAMRPVEKRSAGKTSAGGRKHASRRLAHGIAVAEVLRIGPGDIAVDERPLQLAVMRDGDAVAVDALADARERCRRSLAELPPHAMKLSAGEPAIETVVEPPKSETIKP
ncbi:MAG TPA: nicotinate phosphoribosyltransferase [Mycobacteriales bacterium]|nr:nicotinate phosphoribosyltransferase [Mycobacteriales bacterium]